MNAGALRALEFDRIVSVVAGLAVTPTGRDRLAELHPLTSVAAVVAAQRATSEGTRLLADQPGLPLRAPSDLEAILGALGVDGRALEAAAAARPGRLPRVDRALARGHLQRGRELPDPPGTGRRRRLLQGRDRRCAPQDRSVGRRGRQREPRAGRHPRSPAAPARRSCGRRSSRSCADARRRSTCRSRSSPIATAGTCSSSGPSIDPRFRASCTARRPAAQACSSSR